MVFSVWSVQSDYKEEFNCAGQSEEFWDASLPGHELGTESSQIFGIGSCRIMEMNLAVKKRLHM
jgi:hypothetical protein